MLNQKASLVFFLLIFSTQIFSQVKSIDSESLAKMMQGTYSSQQQSEDDTTYLDIILNMKRMWKDRSEAKWLYLEETAAGMDEPFRQRVYRITNTYEGRFECALFRFNSPLRFAGDYKKDEPLSTLTPDSLLIMDGCSVILTLMNDNSYEGGTQGNDCPSTLNDSKYATTEMTVSQKEITSLIRGYDEKGKQVWGPKKGPYVFVRVSE